MYIVPAEQNKNIVQRYASDSAIHIPIKNGNIYILMKTRQTLSADGEIISIIHADLKKKKIKILVTVEMLKCKMCLNTFKNHCLVFTLKMSTVVYFESHAQYFAAANTWNHNKCVSIHIYKYTSGQQMNCLLLFELYLLNTVLPRTTYSTPIF